MLLPLTDQRQRQDVNKTVVRVDVSPETFKRADALRAWMDTKPALSPTGYTARAQVWREAIARGLASLERERVRDEGKA